MHFKTLSAFLPFIKGLKGLYRMEGWLVFGELRERTLHIEPNNIISPTEPIALLRGV